MHVGRAKHVLKQDETLRRAAWRDLTNHDAELSFERFESQPPPGVRLNRAQRGALRLVNRTLEDYQRVA